MDLFNFTQGRRTSTGVPSAAVTLLFYSSPRLECLSHLLISCSWTVLWQSVMMFTCTGNKLHLVGKYCNEIWSQWCPKSWHMALQLWCCHHLTWYYLPSEWHAQSLACSFSQCERSMDAVQALNFQKDCVFHPGFFSAFVRLLLDTQCSNDNKCYL